MGTIEGCSACVNADCKDNDKEIEAIDRRDVNPGIGDRVELEISGAKTVKATGTLLIPTAAFFTAGYMGMHMLKQPEWLGFVAGFAGALLGLKLSVWIAKTFLMSDLPEVVRVMPFDVFPVDESTEEHPV